MSMKAQDFLRRISVHVEEPRSGAFEWVLSEADATDADADQWRVLKRARNAAKTYKDSMADGLVALQALIDDLDTGPRSPGVLEPEPDRRQARKRPARSAPSEHQKQESPAKATGRTAFGFGVLE
ncbi:hypothetical protein [Variovorax fucosicus]|uniref:hypothetical protein n=1 Tax=Variovorax fucosicus TaxID=3053517 RepID=UPI002575796E|nr:hypothetical protein [Variovorax sp. J22G47]MDM0059098.1 hypothetical protein [Variovorax sp. J22G47]